MTYPRSLRPDAWIERRLDQRRETSPSAPGGPGAASLTNARYGSAGFVPYDFAGSRLVSVVAATGISRLFGCSTVRAYSRLDVREATRRGPSPQTDSLQRRQCLTEPARGRSLDSNLGHFV